MEPLYVSSRWFIMYRTDRKFYVISYETFYDKLVYYDLLKEKIN